jgi:ABC-type transport system substrate-binding protein
MRWLGLLLPLLLLAPANAAPEKRAEMRADGTLRIALFEKIDSLDPPKATTEAGRTCVHNLYDQLYEYHHLRRPYELKPCLAAGPPEMSEDGLTQTFTLRKGIRFADDPCFPGGKGRAVSAHDVVFCLLRLMDAHVESPGRWMLERKIVDLDSFTAASAQAAKNPHRSTYGPDEGYPRVKGLQVLDEHTLRVHLLEPMPELAWLLAGTWMSIYPPQAVKLYGDRLSQHVVSTGPYKVTLFLANKTLLLQRSPTYREDRYPTDGRPKDARKGYLDDAGHLLPLHGHVEVKCHGSPVGAWTAFQAGQADVAEVPRDAFTAVIDPSTGRGLPWVQARKVALHEDPRLEVFYDAFNMEDPVLGQPARAKGRAIRRAICLALDDTWVMNEHYRHKAERVFGPLLPEFASYDREFRNDWLPREGEAREDAIEAARAELAEAGIPEGKGVPPIRVHILNDPTSRIIFDLFKRQVAEVGLTLEPVPVTWHEMLQVLREKKGQMWTSSWYADYPDAQNFLQLYYGPNAPEPNYSNYHNAEYDELYEDARKLGPGQEREDLYREMQRIVASDCPWRFRFRRIRWAASHSWLSGYRHNDIAPKYFKYCRPDEAVRKKAIESWK